MSYLEFKSNPKFNLDSKTGLKSFNKSNFSPAHILKDSKAFYTPMKEFILPARYHKSVTISANYREIKDFFPKVSTPNHFNIIKSTKKLALFPFDLIKSILTFFKNRKHSFTYFL